MLDKEQNSQSGLEKPTLDNIRNFNHPPIATCTLHELAISNNYAPKPRHQHMHGNAQLKNSRRMAFRIAFVTAMSPKWK